MTDKQTPPDWVLIEAGKRFGWEVNNLPRLRLNLLDKAYAPFLALCDMIWKYEQPPVDRMWLCIREAEHLFRYLLGKQGRKVAIRAIELYEEGFGK